MRIANIAGRAHMLVTGGLAIDLAEASAGQWADPQVIYNEWDKFRDWAAALDARHSQPHNPLLLEAPSPRPPQVFAVGLNYRDHADESGFDVPTSPTVFTKFPASIAGPQTTVSLPEGDVDWEVEIVLIIGRPAYKASEERAWEYIAGVTIGQDLSERRAQISGPAPQFSLAKSHVGFGPTGPLMVTPDELPDRDNIEFSCSLNGELMQTGHTRDMIFNVPSLIARLSAVTPLLSGDLVFTGTPPGVGMGRKPTRFLKPGDELVSYAKGIGEMRTYFASTPTGATI